MVYAIHCPRCGDKVFSRATQDERRCSCGRCGISGGRDYTRKIWSPELRAVPEIIEIEVDISEETLYNDWIYGKDEHGIIKEVRH